MIGNETTSPAKVLFVTETTTANRAHAVKYAPALDGLRALAVVAVFFAHAHLLSGGGVGVQVFFALSGYLITSLLLAEWVSSGRISLRAFYARRALRLTPALVVATVVATVVALSLGLMFPWVHAVSALTYTTDLVAPFLPPHHSPIGLTWSLAVEEQFYLVWPLLLIVALRRGWSLPWILLGGIAAGAAATAVSYAAVGEYVTYAAPYTQIPALFTGCLLAWFRHQRPDLRVSPLLGVLALAGLVVCAVLLGYELRRTYYGGYLIVAALSAVVIAACAGSAGSSWLVRCLSFRPLLWLGRRSYGFYLFHSSMLTVAGAWFPDVWVKLAVGGALSLVACAVSWRLVERPFQRLKDRIRRGDTTPVEARVRG